MNKKNKLWTIVIILIILISAFFGSFIYRNKRLKIPTLPTTNSVTYYCQEGILKAVYGPNTVFLSLKDGRTLTLPQTISGSGIRYELGTTTFVGKGDNALLTEDKIDTYTKCVTGIQKTKGETNTYTDTSKTFSFSYPREFNLHGGDFGYTQDWGAQISTMGLLFTVVEIPQTFFQKTNFGDAKFTIGTSSDPEAIKNCLLATNGAVLSKDKVTINGLGFTKITLNDAGAGNYYENTNYRTLKNDQCYSIGYTIHSMNISNYSPDQGIKGFDKAKITSILEGLVQSFTFL